MRPCRTSSAAGLVGVNAARWTMPSTKRKTVVGEAADQPFGAAAIASNTGCTSDGELAITLRMSAVAVCRSSASWVSLNSRAFSIAITAWSAKVCEQLHVVFGECAGLLSRDDDQADGDPLFISGTNSDAAEAARPRQILQIVRVGFAVGIWTTSPSFAIEERQIGRLDAEKRPSGPHLRPGLIGVNAARLTMPSTKRNTVAEKPPISRLALLRDRVEHRLHVGRRTGDHLAGCRRWRSAAPAPPVSR